ILTVTFNDNEVPIGFVNVDWGDGASDSLFYVGDGAGNATVLASHAYLEEGAYFMKVGVTNLFDPADSAATSDTALVADAALVAGVATPVTATEGIAFTQQVATFSDTDPNGTLTSDYEAHIDWGDGTSSIGAVGNLFGTNFQVTGTHTYAEER